MAMTEGRRKIDHEFNLSDRHHPDHSISQQLRLDDLCEQVRSEIVFLEHRLDEIACKDEYCHDDLTAKAYRHRLNQCREQLRQISPD